jgi:DNA-binding MarR family transcriptional regulator
MMTTDTTDDLVRLLPELAVTLFEAVPHHSVRTTSSTPLTTRQMLAVLQLSRRGSLTMSEFADTLAISRAAATEMAERLTEKGLTVREADETDRRRVYLRLSPGASGLAAEALDGLRVHIGAAFARHPDLDPETLVAFLATLTSALRERSEP